MPNESFNEWERSTRHSRYALVCLAAYRLMQVMSWQQAEKLMRKTYGTPLIQGKAQWKEAYANAKRLIEEVRMTAGSPPGATLAPLRLPLAQQEWDFTKCPARELEMCMWYEYSREVVRVGQQ